ncbi:MAG TPA: MBL fold metallo-hydrolase [Clostridia bacterium]|nr:MBL fold metallo-hydrolase [Clostridia bacterium]
MKPKENYVINVLNQRIDLENRVPFRAKDTMEITLDAFDARSDTAIYWLGGGGFLLNSRGTILMVDPVLEMDKELMKCETGHNMLMPYPISASMVPKADCVLYTHPDLDHVGPTTSQILSQKGIKRIAPSPVAIKLIEYGADIDDITVCRSGDRYRVGNLEIEVIKADHPWQLINTKLFGKPLRGDDACGFVVRTPDGSFLFPGDTRLLESHLDIPSIDVILVDTSKCLFHLNVEGAIILCNSYPDAYLIPYHYGMFDEPQTPAQEQGDPKGVFKAVHDAEDRAFTLAPGEPFVLAEGRAELKDNDL